VVFFDGHIDGSVPAWKCKRGNVEMWKCENRQSSEQKDEV